MDLGTDAADRDIQRQIAEETLDAGRWPDLGSIVVLLLVVLSTWCVVRAFLGELYG